jgi:hypothetical protein
VLVKSLSELTCRVPFSEFTIKSDATRQFDDKQSFYRELKVSFCNHDLLNVGKDAVVLA